MTDKRDPNYEPQKVELITDPETGMVCVVVDHVDVTGPLDVRGERKRIYHESWDKTEAEARA